MTKKTTSRPAERYAEHRAAIRAIAERILAATENDRAAMHMSDADFRAIDWGHVGDLSSWREDLQRVSDSMFREGEHAPERNARVSK